MLLTVDFELCFQLDRAVPNSGRMAVGVGSSTIVIAPIATNRGLVIPILVDSAWARFCFYLIKL